MADHLFFQGTHQCILLICSKNTRFLCVTKEQQLASREEEVPVLIPNLQEDQLENIASNHRISAILNRPGTETANLMQAQLKK